jgi:hypothetical protein
MGLALVPRRNQIVERRVVSHVVGNVSLVAIRRILAKRVSVKNRSPVPRKILPAKKKKKPVPIKRGLPKE